jgi:hypothetical protein
VSRVKVSGGLSPRGKGKKQDTSARNALRQNAGTPGRVLDWQRFVYDVYCFVFPFLFLGVVSLRPRVAGRDYGAERSRGKEWE